jgi:DNA-directed RNA polymerase specialized sigma24 family protein
MLDNFPSTTPDPFDLVSIAASDTIFASLRNLSEQREQALIARARFGDQAARDELLLWVLSPVKRFAARYYLAFYWEASAGISPDDLVSEATLRMLERWPAALAASNPLAYLLSVAYATIRHTMIQERSPIHTPYTPGERPIPVKSLHAPLDAESEDTLLDVLPAVTDTASASCDEQEYTLLYEAAARLSERERAVIAEWYGLYETAPASMETILSQIGRTGMGSYKASALMKLYRLLAPVYAQYCGEGYVQELRTPGGQVRLSDSQRERLDIAYAQLRESGQQITVHALGRAAGINTVYASNYLYQQGYRPPSKQQRLDAAYAQLHENGQQITASRLAHTAQISHTQASLYLQQRGEGVSYYQRVQPTEDRALRVAAAYARLQESGQPITRRTLGAAAHVNWHYAATYIQQQQGGPSSPPRFGGKRDAHAREARLAQAYEQLQHGARLLSAETLCKAAHVRRQTAAAYLQQRRASAPKEVLA